MDITISRRTAVVLALGTVAAATVLYLVNRPGPNDPKAWLNQPMRAPRAFATRPPQPDAGPCTAATLASTVRTQKSEQTAGLTTYTFVLRNGGDGVCTLKGAVRVELGGKQGTVGAVDDEPGPDRQYPATIARGEYASVDVETATECWASTVATTATVHIGSRSYPLPGKVCDVRAGDWYAEPVPVLAPVTVRVDAPATVRRGTDLNYTVTLVNNGDDQYCPVYGEGFGESETWRYYLLNCMRQVIPAHSTRKFAIRFAVPAGTPPGRTKLHWVGFMNDGALAYGDGELGGRSITVT